MIGTLQELAAAVHDGAKVAIPGDDRGIAMSATREILRAGVKNLHLVTVPIAGIQADILIGAGCVATIECSAVTLAEYGGAPRFNEAVRGGRVKVLDATCPAIHAGLQAAQKGQPFVPIRGLLETDVLAHRPDWKTIDNPFNPGEPIVLIPSIRPDVALFHAPLADRDGNVFIGRKRELLNMAHASAATLVTVEEISNESLLADEARAAGVIPAEYITRIAVAKRGFWPVRFWDTHPEDETALKLYAKMARTLEGFDEWMAEWMAEPAMV